MNYVCSECGYKAAKWLGRCPKCTSWDTFTVYKEKTKVDKSNKIVPSNLSEVTSSSTERYSSGIVEFDRILGGGLTKGSVVLLSGEPGIGKSTLLLQVLSRYSERHRVLYISGEESESQVKSRADRLNICSNIKIASSSDICAVIDAAKTSDIVAIDSIQTMVSNDLGSSPGTMSQVRESISKIINLAKSNNISFIVVGHINKDGKVAGPKTLEHMVDTMIEFEGDKDFQYRVLRSTKNRFGSVNGIGIFDMKSDGIREVTNPSEFFVSDKRTSSIGSVVTPIIEGNRTFLVEVQALVTASLFGMPRRISQGIDTSRVQILSAITEKYLNINLANNDIFFNIPGILRVKDPSIGLSLILAIVSSFKNIVVEAVAVGEIGLSGEIRRVSFIEKRIREAERVGVKKIFVPKANIKEMKKSKIEVIGLENVKEIFKYLVKEKLESN